MEETRHYIPIVRKLPNKVEDLTLRVDKLSVLMHSFVNKD